MSERASESKAASERASESMAASEQLRRRRPNLNFEEMGIPVGARLIHVEGQSFVTVASARKVSFNNEEMSLTAATRLVLNIEHDVAPGPHWTYEGKLLRDIYNETYGDA